MYANSRQVLSKNATAARFALIGGGVSYFFLPTSAFFMTAKFTVQEERRLLFCPASSVRTSTPLLAELVPKKTKLTGFPTYVFVMPHDFTKFVTSFVELLVSPGWRDVSDGPLPRPE